ncbi:MAG: hypothetical protein FJ255_09905 [Phycisphaerae bacterium]|nr:hypothetical protein [Phycisphaerae bacterium]
MSDAGERFHVRLADGRQFGPADPDLLRQWAVERRIPPGAHLVPESGGEAIPAIDHPALRPLLTAPPTMPGAISDARPDAISTLIPYRNPAALTGYYVGVLALIPGVGLVAGPIAVLLGIAGLRHARACAHARGRAHAWVAIALGSLTFLGNGAILFFYLASR